MDEPSWFRQLRWSDPIHIAALNGDRGQIPDFTGCYAFTLGRILLSPGRVLYIGEAARQSLRDRLATYLIDFRIRPLASNSRVHKGKGLILQERKERTDHAVFVRWVEYGASEHDIHILEASLINYLNPTANDRVEEYRHPVLGDRARLNSRLIR